MLPRFAPAAAEPLADRIVRTVALMRRRGYAVSPARLAELCAGGAVSEADVRWAVAASSRLVLAEGLVVERDSTPRARAIAARAESHLRDARPYRELTLGFVETLVRVAPFVRSVSIAGSLASGGFRASDDVDLNLIVDDGHRHIAYFVVNLLGAAHALPRRGKPVDEHTRRPIVPRLMTANLILERSQCLPLERQDEDMAFELLTCEPVFGLDSFDEVLAANPALSRHFPQLGARRSADAVRPRRRLPRCLFPARLDGVARAAGEAAWRYMQWTRRHRPEALAHVAYVRSTMRPYALFDRDRR